MSRAADQVLGYPLFAVGIVSLGVGLTISTYWPMSLGLLAMTAGALRFTQRW